MSPPTRRRFKLAKCLIEFRIDRGKEIKQKNCYGEYVAHEPLGAAKKAFKELATSLEIKNKTNLAQPVLFELVETTNGVHKVKMFIGSRTHHNPPIIKKIKVGGQTKDIPIKYEDHVQTLKPSSTIPANIMRLDKDLRMSRRKTVIQREASDRIGSMIEDVKEPN